MKATELRIGNLVQWGLGIHEWEMDSYNYHDLDYAKPIPLTEEWLLKFGFDRLSKDWFELRCKAASGFYSLDVNVEMKLSIDVNNESMEYPLDLEHIKHVHQLQNLYFALTGKELTIAE